MHALCIAHRGGAGLRPENTLSAFAHAGVLGCDGVELDVQLTRDGEVVVFHDERLNPDLCRNAEGSWLKRPGPPLIECSYAELAQYDVGRPRPGSAYARSHPRLVAADGQRIPRLAEVVAVAKAAPAPYRLFVELKTSFLDRSLSASPEATAEAVLAVLRREDYLHRTVLVGFDWPGLLHAKSIAPSVPCWFTTLPQGWFGTDPLPEGDGLADQATRAKLREWASSGTSPWAGGYDAVGFGGCILKAIKAAGADGWFPHYRDATAERIGDARKLGLKIGAWTVDDPADLRALSQLDALCTDRPDVFKRVQGHKPSNSAVDR